MDVRKAKPPGSTALQKTLEECLRPPLVPSERIHKNNAAPMACKPRTREVSSRYKSGITPITTSPSTPATSQRYPSPDANRTGLSPPPFLSKRSQSSERRRPTTPTHRTSVPSSPSKTSTQSSPTLSHSTPVHDIVADMQLSSRRLSGGRLPDGLWPSMRSLSASFQSEPISVPLSKMDGPVSNSDLVPNQTLKFSANVKLDRKRTPSKGKNAHTQSENLKPMENLHTRVVDQHRWPRIKNEKFSARDMSRSMNFTDRVSRSGTLPSSFRGVSPIRKAHISEEPSRGFQKTPTEETKQMLSDGSGGLEHESRSATSVPVNPSERAPSFTRPSGTVTRLPEGSPCSSSSVKTSLPPASSRSMASPSRTRPSAPSSPSKNSLASASSRSTASPSRTRPSTPSSPRMNSLPAVSSRSMASPSRTRPSTPPSSFVSGQSGISSSVLSYVADIRKGKKSSNQIESAHQLRLLYNRDLQWHFVNARQDTAMSVHKMMTENILYSVWMTTSELHDSVIMKRTKMQRQRQDMKLALILNEQMEYLEDWALSERAHSSSLLGAIEALKASTLRLPVAGGARVEVHALKGAISSAVDVMQAMSSSIYHLLSRVQGMTSVVSELDKVTTKERAMLNECRELLASVAAMQVQESSLRTHFLQLRQDMIRDGSRS